VRCEKRKQILGHRSRPFFISIPLKGTCEANILYLSGKTSDTTNLDHIRKIGLKHCPGHGKKYSPSRVRPTNSEVGAIVQGHTAANSAGDDGGQAPGR